jgi:hypothetical protein
VAMKAVYHVFRTYLHQLPLLYRCEILGIPNLSVHFTKLEQECLQVVHSLV